MNEGMDEYIKDLLFGSIRWGGLGGVGMGLVMC